MPHGTVFDVAVDVRWGSPTFGQWTGGLFSGENRHQFFIPKGFAHGFCVLSDDALVTYKCSAYYAAGDEIVIRWDDPDIGIEWPVDQPILSPKDANGVFLKDLHPDVLPHFDATAV